MDKNNKYDENNITFLEIVITFMYVSLMFVIPFFIHYFYWLEEGCVMWSLIILEIAMFPIYYKIIYPLFRRNNKDIKHNTEKSNIIKNENFS